MTRQGREGSCKDDNSTAVGLAAQALWRGGGAGDRGGRGEERELGREIDTVSSIKTVVKRAEDQRAVQG